MFVMHVGMNAEEAENTNADAEDADADADAKDPAVDADADAPSAEAALEAAEEEAEDLKSRGLNVYSHWAKYYKKYPVECKYYQPINQLK